MRPALLVLEDGSKFYGQAIGIAGESIGEIVFNTSITGYQEIITDPSYYYQIVVFTYPHIGNVGINRLDNESNRSQVSGIVIRNLSIFASNFRYELSFSEYLFQQKIVGIADVDTRRLTRLIREKGTQRACIITNNISVDIALILHKLRQFSALNESELIYKVSTTQKYTWNQGSYDIRSAEWRDSSYLPYHVVVYDFGVKRNLMRILVDHGCLLTVVPAYTTAREIVDMHPDGIFLSNGPGNPIIYEHAISSIQFFLKRTNIPLFGICLGHQLLALASGAKTIKMKFGHHGVNHPVKDLITNKIIITSQNHNFVVEKNSLPKILKITHISLFDRTIQGIRHCDKPAFSFQGHPEASPGPHDSMSLFNNFLNLIKNYHNSK